MPPALLCYDTNPQFPDVDIKVYTLITIANIELHRDSNNIGQIYTNHVYTINILIFKTIKIECECTISSPEKTLSSKVS